MVSFVSSNNAKDHNVAIITGHKTGTVMARKISQCIAGHHIVIEDQNAHLLR